MRMGWPQPLVLTNPEHKTDCVHHSKRSSIRTASSTSEYMRRSVCALYSSQGRRTVSLGADLPDVWHFLRCEGVNKGLGFFQ